LQKGQEFFGPMTLGNPSNHLAGHDVESGVQTRCSMAFVVVRATFDLTRAQRQHRLSTIQRLDLVFLVTDNTRALSGGFR